MRELKAILLILAGLMIVACVAVEYSLGAEWPSRPDAGWSTDAVVVRTIDGDTLQVEIRRTMTVRLLDCWAPESRTRDLEEKQRGLAAKAHLEQICPPGAAVRLWIPVRNEDLAQSLTLGRALGHVWLASDDKSLSQHQVEAGHAEREKPPKPPATSSRRPVRDWHRLVASRQLAI